ncbi:FlgO family outer membrane protein [Leptospira kanakyensis]|uniref:Curli production assembly/transport component CsgG domain protein n=1 Tax=Leptospira kanakyensis TaxID=2484968 RepID=A0A6N4Q8G7_9LEPT|nr:FlgO family outer membrane protein [Leptospira kanakyensis]TGK54594.1 curli production assembly/transport component CsgG domain protein [Leptospira kanakyensis]TGK59155.1 curli production assembly/transport component CsgG domain protein [Leptospira kanakyensis]TGK75360.1 curli production assembly/transport component CsgG domain protein [Leptospira kanakyensis]
MNRLPLLGWNLPFRILSILIFLLSVNACYFGEERESKPKKLPTPPLEQLATSLSESGFYFKPQRLVVLTFLDNEGKKSPYGEILAEKLTTELVKKERFQILDRLANQKVLKEAGLGLDIPTDTATLRKIGDVLKLDVIITGIVTPYQDGVFVNTRLIEIKSGLILKADEVYVRIDG